MNLRKNQVFLGEEEKIKAKKGDSRSSDPIPRSGNRRSKRFRAFSEQRTKEERESKTARKKGMTTIKTTKALFASDHD